MKAIKNPPFSKIEPLPGADTYMATDEQVIAKIEEFEAKVRNTNDINRPTIQ
jgi:hypothetical protein